MRRTLPITLLAALSLSVWTSTSAAAKPMPKATYLADMASLDAIEILINTTITDLGNGMPPAEARAALPHIQERLQWMRDTKVTAARIDTSHTLRTMSADSQRAQCIIMRAGLMDEVFQDVMVNISMKARGVADNALLPMDQEAFDIVIGGNLCHP